jgi:GST-like protein
MIITRESLVERFRLLSDEDLLGLLQSGDLIDLAKELAAEELQRRGVEVATPATESNTASEDALGSEDDAPSGGETSWYEGDLVVIARFSTPAEALVLQSRLRADDVPALVPDAYSWQGVGGGAPISVFESGAILLYLAEKTGKFISADLRGRVQTLEWLFWQMGGLGPMSGQNNHFAHYAVDKLPYAIDRYRNEVNRLYGVMDRRLADRPYLAGDYSIADMACYPWVVPHERQGQNIADFPHLKRWLDAVAARPAVVRAYALASEINPQGGGIRTAEERAILFGQTAASVQAAVR